MIKRTFNKQAGAVSLFVVVFAMLLLTVVTVSFLRLMMNDLRQASDTDLSQSAYDSAQAGVEDAKRALLRYQAYCAVNSAADCKTLASQLSTDTCNSAVRVGGVVPGSGSGEVAVQSNTSSTTSASFDQAYTCVTMKLNTEDVIGTLTEGSSKFIPLKAVNAAGNDTAFNQVTISWFDQKDLSSPSQPVSLTNSATPLSLLKQASWPANRPPIVRTQLMQTGSSFTLDSFDIVNASSQSNANTLFLYPTGPTAGNTSSAFVGRDIRASNATDSPDADDPSDSPLATRCVTSVSSGGYACSITLTLPAPIGGGTARQGYLRLTPFYKGANFRVTLGNNGTQVFFKAVQPSIDSTGRANDLFRRVESRVELTDSSLPLPEAGVDVTTEFCKDFTVTDTQMIPATCTYS